MTDPALLLGAKVLTWNTNTKGRMQQNMATLDHLKEGELFYVYGLVNLETGEVGYIGTTYDLHKRRQHHKSDLRKFLDGTYYRQSPSKVAWQARQSDPPEMKVFAICPTRKDAEFIEKGLVRAFQMSGNYHYWKYRPEHDAMQTTIFDDIPDDDIPFT